MATWHSAPLLSVSITASFQKASSSVSYHFGLVILGHLCSQILSIKLDLFSTLLSVLGTLSFWSVLPHILLNSFLISHRNYEIWDILKLFFTLKYPFRCSLLAITVWHVGEQKSHDTEVRIHNCLQCIWCASLTNIQEILSPSLKSSFCRSLTFFLRVPHSLCQSGVGFLSIQCYFFFLNSPNYLFFRILLSSSWSLLSVSVTVSECLFKPASTSVTLPFIAIPWKRHSSKLSLMLAQTVIL